MPLLRGSWADGFDYTCPGCDQVLIENTIDGQFWNLSFKCYRCSVASETPRLPRGAQIPPHFLELPMVPGVIVTGPVAMPNVCITSTVAVEQRLGETGVQGATFGPNSTIRPIPLRHSALRELLSDLEASLGTLLTAILRDDESFRRKTGQHRDRLAWIVERVRKSLSSDLTLSPSFDTTAIDEMQALVHLLERWRRDPRWSDLMKVLRTDYEHTLLMLLTASLLHDAGNSVQLVREASTRLPDLWVVKGIREVISVEVKAPSSLVRRVPSSITADSSVELVRSAIKSAAEGEKRQLPKNQPSLLVIGGLFLSEQSHRALTEGANRYLSHARDARKHRHLLGVAIISLYGLVKVQPPWLPTTSPAARLTYARNEGYVGEYSVGSSGSELNVIRDARRIEITGRNIGLGPMPIIIPPPAEGG